MTAEDIAKLYGARWDIEQLFKELKSKYALDVLETKIGLTHFEGENQRH